MGLFYSEFLLSLYFSKGLSVFDSTKYSSTVCDFLFDLSKSPFSFS